MTVAGSPRLKGALAVRIRTIHQRAEIICGAVALGLGLGLLLVAYLQPYSESNGTGTAVLKLHPGFNASGLPYIVALGLPILGIALASLADGFYPSRVARVALWVATIILGLEMLLTILSLGWLLFPIFVAGVCAAGFAIDATRISRLSQPAHT
jgi:hypothetical protein